MAQGRYGDAVTVSEPSEPGSRPRAHPPIRHGGTPVRHASGSRGQRPLGPVARARRGKGCHRPARRTGDRPWTITSRTNPSKTRVSRPASGGEGGRTWRCSHHPDPLVPGWGRPA